MKPANQQPYPTEAGQEGQGSSAVPRFPAFGADQGLAHAQSVQAFVRQPPGHAGVPQFYAQSPAVGMAMPQMQMMVPAPMMMAPVPVMQAPPPQQQQPQYYHSYVRPHAMPFALQPTAATTPSPTMYAPGMPPSAYQQVVFHYPHVVQQQPYAGSPAFAPPGVPTQPITGMWPGGMIPVMREDASPTGLGHYSRKSGCATSPPSRQGQEREEKRVAASSQESDRSPVKKTKLSGVSRSEYSNGEDTEETAESKNGTARKKCGDDDNSTNKNAGEQEEEDYLVDDDLEDSCGGEKRLVIHFTSLGDLGERPQRIGKRRAFVPDGLGGRFKMYQENFSFYIEHSKELSMCRDNVERVCVTWTVINEPSRQVTKVVETPQDALRRQVSGKTICNRVYKDVLEKRAQSFEEEMRMEIGKNEGRNEVRIAHLASMVRLFRPKTFSLGPLAFGLLHTTTQARMLKEARQRGVDI